MTTEDIRWEDPPKPKTGLEPAKYDTLKKALRDNPGEWAWVRDAADHAQLGSLQARFKHEGFEAVNRKLADGKVHLYARWPKPFQAAIPDDNDGEENSPDDDF